jgi:hypothetical protein
MTNELVEKLLEPGIIEKVRKSEIQKMVVWPHILDVF